MLAIGIYPRSNYGASYETLFTPFLDEQLVRAQFIREFGSEPCQIIILQNGQNDPRIITTLTPSLSVGGWKLMWSSIGAAMVSMVLMFVLMANRIFYKYGWICIAMMLVSCGIILYMRRREKNNLLKGNP